MNIVSNERGGSWAAYEGLVENEKGLITRVTDEMIEDWGLGRKKVLLAEDHKFSLYRRGRDLFVEDIASGVQVTFRIEESDGRSKVIPSQLKKRLRAFYDHLRPTGIWDSIRSNRTKVYVYRLSYALAYGTDMRWNGDNTKDHQDRSPTLLGVNHINGHKECDIWTNLELLTYEEHAKVENERSAQVWDEAFTIVRGSADEWAQDDEKWTPVDEAIELWYREHQEMLWDAAEVAELRMEMAWERVA